ncbi:hypothetical protein UFOVP470_6 [uncultured Caudovirales phage]|jgi:hypothetical protein|uniref:Uncharacterized protein n=1 Tax=uncultured Caudovirales phage TaxID=2100421 RepID=A0A6J5MBA7_9CAUD|nr:hypothetical protein UFOVP470_6 [uncultured Caudovirales phage]
MSHLLVSDVLAQARELLQDKVSPYRYSDDSLFYAINEAIFEARRLRPDLFVGRLRISIERVGAGTDAFPLDDMYFSSTVNYVVGRAEMRDDEFANDKRAALLHSAFYTALVKGA